MAYMKDSTGRRLDEFKVADAATLPPARAARGARLPLTMISGSVFTPGGGTNTTDVAVGTLNHHVTSDGAGTFTNWHRQTAITPQNMVGKGFMFMIKATNVQNLQYLTVQASNDNTMPGYFQHRIPVPANGGKSVLREGEWATVYVPWSSMNIMAKVGTPDATSIIAVKLTPADYGGGNTARLDIGALIGVYTDPAAAGSVIISCDDSYVEAVTVAQKLGAVGWRGVLHPIIERLGTATFLTVAQVQRLQNLYGWEIGAHCMTNAQHVSLVGQPKAQIEAMLTECRAWQRANGVESNAFAYPIGPFDKNAVDAVSAHYGYARTNDELPTPSRLPQPLMASAVALSGTANTLASVKLMLDQVAANKSMINIIVHRLIPSGTPVQNEWLQSDFNALIDYAVSLGLKNTTTAQMLALT